MRLIRRERVRLIKYGGFHKGGETCTRQPDAYLEIHRLKLLKNHIFYVTCFSTQTNLISGMK